MLANNCSLNTLRIIKKASKYVFGDTLLEKIRTNKIFLVIIATDAGKASQKKIIDKCNSFSVSYIIDFDKDTLANIFSKNISSIGIVDKNLTDKFLENYQK